MIKDTKVYAETKEYCPKCDYETIQRSYVVGRFCSVCNSLVEEYDWENEPEYKNERLAFKISAFLFVLMGCGVAFGLFYLIKTILRIWI